MSQSDCEKFWDLIEVKFGCSVPRYVQNILALNGYDNALSVKTIGAEDMEYFQKYAREEMHKSVPQNADLRDYYGSFYKSKEDFVFLRGHVKLIEQIVFLINTTIASKGTEVFNFKKLPKMQPTKITARKDLQGKSLIKASTKGIISHNKY